MIRCMSMVRGAAAAGIVLSSLALSAPARAGRGPMPPVGNRAETAAVEFPSGLEGVASYYARRFEGRRTTSGERYRAENLTAAHPKLPLGTRVRVVHLESGREVVVEVNDRCRKRRFPFIDLSRAAARELGFLGKGIARVRIQPLDKDPPGPESAEQAAE